MKKLLVIGVALFAAMMFVTPASATDLQLGGYYFVQGRIQDTPSLDGDDDAGGASWRHRFRFQPAFIVNDAIRFDMKMDIFDGTRFGTRGPKDNRGTDIDFDRAWMTIKVPFGSFAAGRMAGGAWGLTFGDDNEDYDRVRFDTKIGDVATGVIVQKNVEDDWGPNGRVDADVDTYYLYGNYKGGIGSFGLLGAYVNNKANPVVDANKIALLPYFDLRFGMFGVRGELIWAEGENDPDAAGAATTDVEELAWNLEADVQFGPLTLVGGYAWVQGDPTAGDDKIKETNLAYGGIGDDWDLLVVMMDVDQFINGHALAAPGASIQGAAGVELAYAELQWKPSKAWRFWTTVGYAKAEETGQFPAGTDDEIGWEYDVNAQWAVMKNLRAMVRFGYFDAGDFWKFGDPTFDLENTWTAYHEWRISF